MSENPQRPDLSSTFSDYLCLLSLCGPTVPPSVQHKGSTQSAWAQFLDELGWLCDYKPGGKTVAAVAAGCEGSKIRYWVANNNGCGLLVAKHLSWVLEKLQIVISDGKAAHEVEVQIFKKCIGFSRKRVTEYANKLHLFIGFSKSLGRGLTEGM